jgi:hypothetical protein
MTQDERRGILNRAVLQALANCGAYLLPEPILVAHLQMSAAPPPTILECQEVIAAMEAERFIVGITPKLGGPRKWQITDLGRTALAN